MHSFGVEWIVGSLQALKEWCYCASGKFRSWWSVICGKLCRSGSLMSSTRGRPVAWSERSSASAGATRLTSRSFSTVLCSTCCPYGPFIGLPATTVIIATVFTYTGYWLLHMSLLPRRPPATVLDWLWTLVRGMLRSLESTQWISSACVRKWKVLHMGCGIA